MISKKAKKIMEKYGIEEEKFYNTTWIGNSGWCCLNHDVKIEITDEDGGIVGVLKIIKNKICFVAL